MDVFEGGYVSLFRHKSTGTLYLGNEIRSEEQCREYARKLDLTPSPIWDCIGYVCILKQDIRK